MTPMQKNLSQSLLILVLCVLGCGGGSGSGPCGGAGQQCCDWPATSCSGASVSCQSGTCRSCGTEGGPCCGLNHDCNSNLFCNAPPGGPAFVCQACGHIGQATCVNNSCVTGVASGGRCVAPGSAEAMCNGSMPFTIGLRSRRDHCRYQEYAVRANSPEDARVCAERAGRLGGWADPEAVDTSAWDEYPFTSTSSLTGCDIVHFSAYSVEDAEFCARLRFPDRTIARGSACPTPSP